MQANAKPVFTKKWWQENRSSKCKGCGVGKALTAWESHCTESNVKKLSKPEDFENAFSACDALKKALIKAKSKCGKRQKETAACIDKYEVQRAAHEKDVRNEYNQRVAKFRSDRQELLQFTKGAIEAMAAYEQKMKKFADYIEEQEELALKDMKENAGLMAKQFYDSGKNAHPAAGSLMKEVNQRYEKDGKFIKERRGGKYNAKSYGVMSADNKKLSKIFNAATKNTNVASNHYSKAKTYFESVQDDFESLTSLYFRGKKTNKEFLEDARKLAGNAKEMAKSISEGIGRMSNTLSTLDTMAKNARKTPATQDEVDTVVMYLTKVEADENRVNQEFARMQRLCTKGLKRLPDELNRDRAMKPNLDSIRTSLMQAVAATTEMGKDVTKAQQDGKTVATSVG